jgi:hypothetical protein
MIRESRDSCKKFIAAALIFDLAPNGPKTAIDMRVSHFSVSGFCTILWDSGFKRTHFTQDA